jgi:CheY-like chemotaxis protein
VQTFGYDVLHADSGDDALAICKSQASWIDLIISDVVMPRMNGRELAECVNLTYPGVPVIFVVSGYPASREIVVGLTGRGFENGFTYLQKPFTPQELLKAIKSAFETAPKSNTLTALT